MYDDDDIYILYSSINLLLREEEGKRFRLALNEEIINLDFNTGQT